MQPTCRVLASLSANKTPGQVLTLIPGWAFFFFLMHSVGDDAEIKGFDPFAILGVTPSTEAREIKKQYRALSLIYHPDKVSVNSISVTADGG